MSGSREAVAFEQCTSKQNSIFLVNITGSANGVVTEVEKVDKSVASQHFYTAKILEVLYRNSQEKIHSESWHIRFEQPEKEKVDKTRKKGLKNLSKNDEIFITHEEDITYTIIYHVEGRHKIFIYSYCPDEAKKVETGQNYIFIPMNLFSEQNGVYYGNIRYGLFPDTPEIRMKIKNIQEKKAD